MAFIITKDLPTRCDFCSSTATRLIYFSLFFVTGIMLLCERHHLKLTQLDWYEQKRVLRGWRTL